MDAAGSQYEPCPSGPSNPLYQELSRPRKEIRLLGIASSADGDKVSCTMSTVSLDDGPRFVALSYVWGDPTDAVLVNVNGQDVSVTGTLDVALRHIKKHWQDLNPSENPESFRLWADALCINQEDDDEKGHQVKLMADVYSRAEVVFASLKYPDPEVMGLAFEAIQMINAAVKRLRGDDDGELQSNDDDDGGPQFLSDPVLCRELFSEDESINNPVKNKWWLALREFFELPNWKRVWIFQELVLARQLVLFCATRAVSYEEVLRVTNALTTQKRHLSNGIPVPEDWPMWLVAAVDICVNRDFTVSVEEVKVCLLDTAEENLSMWWGNIYTAFLLQATDPRDYIYGLLSVTPAKLQPNYKKPVAEVYADYFSAMLQSPQKPKVPLFFLSWGGGPHGLDTGMENFPSWMPRFGRKLNMPGCYQADLGFDNGHDAFIQGQDLFADGIPLAQLSLLSEVVTSEAWQSESLQEYIRAFVSRHPRYYPGGIPGIQAVCRTALCEPFSEDLRLSVLRVIGLLRCTVDSDQTEMRAKALSCFGFAAEPGFQLTKKAFREAIFPELETRDEDMIPGDNDDELCGSSPLDMQTIYALDIISDLEDEARFAETSGNWGVDNEGLLALVPKDALGGDFIYVLKGCPQPVVLRKEADHFILIGACFVLGFMDGELVRAMESRRESAVEQVRIK